MPSSSELNQVIDIEVAQTFGEGQVPLFSSSQNIVFPSGLQILDNGTIDFSCDFPTTETTVSLTNNVASIAFAATNFSASGTCTLQARARTTILGTHFLTSPDFFYLGTGFQTLGFGYQLASISVTPVNASVTLELSETRTSPGSPFELTYTIRSHERGAGLAGQLVHNLEAFHEGTNFESVISLENCGPESLVSIGGSLLELTNIEISATDMCVLTVKANVSPNTPMGTSTTTATFNGVSTVSGALTQPPTMCD